MDTFYEGDVVVRDDDGYHKITFEDVSVGPLTEFGVWHKGHVFWNTDPQPVWVVDIASPAPDGCFAIKAMG